MNSTQVALSIVGVLLLFMASMFLVRKLAGLIVFPRSLPSLLAAMLFFPALCVLFIIWMIVISAAGDRGAGDAIIAGFAALNRPVFGGMFLVIYAFCVFMGLIVYFSSYLGERGGRAFAASRGLAFSKEGRDFRLNPSLGGSLLELRNVVTLSPDSCIGAFAESSPSPGTRRRGYTILSLAVGPMGSGGPSGTLFIDGMEGDGHETIEAKGVTAMAPRGEGPRWRALLLSLLDVIDPSRCPLAAVSVHDGQITLLGAQLGSQEGYAQMATLLAAAQAHRPA